MRKDIFISYKTNSSGESFGHRLRDKLDNLGYSVYFNPHEKRSRDFREKIKNAVLNCTDFIVMLDNQYLEQLSQNKQIDYIRYEILIAKENNKNIIPLYLNINITEWYGKLSENLDFLLYIDGIAIHDEKFFDISSFDRILKEGIKSLPEKEEEYRDTYNSNSYYNVIHDFNKTLKEAESGNEEAIYELANMYFYGFSDKNGKSNRNFPEAYHWFKYLSDNEGKYTAFADSMIAKMHYRGIVPSEKQSFEKSINYHKKAASKSGYSAQQLAFMLSRGMGTSFDYNAAEKQYLSVIQSGDNVAIKDLADFYMQYGEFKKAEALYQSILDRYPMAAYELGCLYMNGVLSDDKKPDCFKAAVFFQQAITNENSAILANYQLGLLYFRGTNGFPINYKIAYKYFKAAADNKNADSAYMLGYMYEHGHIGVNIEKAIYYHTLATEHGHILSPTHLAQLYQLSECKNYHKAFKYASLSADYGEKEGEFILGNLLLFGRGCEPNIEKAYEMYSKASNHGVDQAQFMMKKIEQIKNTPIS